MAFMVEPDASDRFTKPQPPPGSSRERARRLGVLIAKHLEHLSLSHEAFAELLGIQAKLVDSMVAGMFPLSQLDDDLLALMAYHLHLSDDALRVFRDAEIKPALPTLPDAEPDDDTAPSRQDIFAMLRDVQDEFSADGQDACRTPPPHLSRISSVLDEIREGEQVEPPQKDDGPIQLRRIDDTLKSFQDNGGEEDE